MDSVPSTDWTLFLQDGHIGSVQRITEGAKQLSPPEVLPTQLTAQTENGASQRDLVTVVIIVEGNVELQEESKRIDQHPPESLLLSDSVTHSASL